MQKEPLVSIIMPNYNCGKYVKETINSVINQSYENWELIFIDDCSTDKSIEIVEKNYKNNTKIKIEKFDKNRGAAEARNYGIKLARGKYVAFLDSDDLWVSDKLKKQIEFMEKNNVDFTYSEYTHIDENGNPLKMKAKVPSELSYKKMLYHCYTGCLTVVYNQEKIGKVCGPNISKSNDYGLFLQVLKKVDRARGIKENLAFYRIRKNSISRNKWKKFMPHFYLLNKIERKNKVMSLFYIFTNVIVKMLWKYEKLR